MTDGTSMKSANESWADVVGYENVYQVSNQGRVMRVLASKQAKVGLKKPCLNRRGYMVVSLWHKNKGATRPIHRLVAQAFVSGDQSLSVNHINGDKLDNRAENLEWISLAENTKHQWRNGLSNASKCFAPSKVPIEHRPLIAERVANGELQKDIAAEYGCSQPLISWICQKVMG